MKAVAIILLLSSFKVKNLNILFCFVPYQKPEMSLLDFLWFQKTVTGSRLIKETFFVGYDIMQHPVVH